MIIDADTRCVVAGTEESLYEKLCRFFQYQDNAMSPATDKATGSDVSDLQLLYLLNEYPSLIDDGQIARATRLQKEFVAWSSRASSSSSQTPDPISPKVKQPCSSFLQINRDGTYIFIYFFAP